MSAPNFSNFNYVLILTLILFPRVKPYVKNIIDNEYVLDLGLGITIFIIVIL